MVRHALDVVGGRDGLVAEHQAQPGQEPQPGPPVRELADLPVVDEPGTRGTEDRLSGVQEVAGAGERPRGRPDAPRAPSRPADLGSGRPAAGGTSYESLNFPGSYLRHHADGVYLARSGGPNAWDAASSFAADATWSTGEPALWRSSVLLPTDVRRSLRVTTWGNTDRYLRHADSLAWTETVNAGSGALLKQDATYTLRRGLADSSCYSFESVNYPGRYLRHTDSRVRTAADDGSVLFRQDATFRARPGIGGTGVTFESLNIPGSSVRHFESAVYIASDTGSGGFDRPQTLGADSSWSVEAPWAP
ncbi:Beta-galactosidase [Streptomyces venezuelae]|nr:Beta-galactosidase [Streptomyces venezuelae]CUM35668.1 Beta-galactosidase [Streptomyces venezuelae]